MVRPGQVAPAPSVDEEETHREQSKSIATGEDASGGTSIASSSSFKSSPSYLRPSSLLRPQSRSKNNNQPTATTAVGPNNARVVPHNHVLSSSPPPLASSSSMEETTQEGDDVEEEDDEHDAPVSFPEGQRKPRHHHHYQNQQQQQQHHWSLDGDHRLDPDLYSLEDPYVYSDDSASLSDAYFMQPPVSTGGGTAATTTTTTNISGGRGGVFGWLSYGTAMNKNNTNDNPNNSSILSNDSDRSGSRSSSGRSPLMFGLSPPQSLPSLLGNVGLGNEDEDDAVDRLAIEARRGYDDEEDRLIDEDLLNETTALVSWHRNKSNSTQPRRSKKRRSSRTKKDLSGASKSTPRRPGSLLNGPLMDDPTQLEQGTANDPFPSSSERERVVQAIRGRPQPTSVQKHRVWVWLFFAQLLFVCGCAMTYGWTLLKESTATEVPANVNQGTSNNGQRQRRALLNLLSDVSVLAPSSSKSDPSLGLSASSPVTVTETAISSLQDKADQAGFDSFHGTSATSSAKKHTSKSVVSQHLQDDDSTGQIEPEIHRPVAAPDASTSKTQTQNREDLIHNNGATLSIDYQNVMSLVFISGSFATFAVYLSFAFMVIVAKSLIPIMLISSLLLSLCWSVFGFTLSGIASDGDGDGEAEGSSATTDVPSYGINLIASFGVASFAFTLCYTISSWKRVGFCSTNLYMAICGIRGSFSVLLIGLSSLVLALFWVLVWSLAAIGILNMNFIAACGSSGDCGANIDDRLMLYSGWHIFELVMLVISFFWTVAVIKNSASVYVAKAIGAWWNTPSSDVAAPLSPTTSSRVDDDDGRRPDEEPRCCNWSSHSVPGPLSKACSISFEAICFGSLIGFPAQSLSAIISFFVRLGDLLDEEESRRKRKRNSVDSNLKAGVATFSNEDSMGGSDESFGKNTAEDEIMQQPPSSSCGSRFLWKLRSCNRWAFTYVGLYNYSFLEGGEKAIQLFETREWMEIAKDSLIPSVLLIGSALIGGSTGAVAVVVEELDGYMFTSIHKPVAASFWIGFLLGFVLSNVLLLGLVGSAVNTILTLFAAEPFAFDRNHPRLSREMREVWGQEVWR